MQPPTHFGEVLTSFTSHGMRVKKKILIKLKLKAFYIILKGVIYYLINASIFDSTSFLDMQRVVLYIHMSIDSAELGPLKLNKYYILTWQIRVLKSK